MKKVVIAIAILSLILVAGILEAVYIDRVFGDLGGRLDALATMIFEEDDKSSESIDDLTNWWEKKREYIELFAYSPDLRSFSIALAETKGSIERGDFDNALSKCESLKVMADNIHKVLDFNGLDII